MTFKLACNTRWSSVRLGDLADFINGRGFKKSEWRDNGLPIIRIQNLTDHTKSFNCYQGEYSDDILIVDGDILFSWSASLGAFVWQRGSALLNQHIYKVEPKRMILREYLFFVLQIVAKELEGRVHGSTMKHITKSFFEEIKVPVPAILVQERIVQILQKADDIRRKRREALKIAEAVLPALFYEIFGDPVENPKGWPIVSMERLVPDGLYGTSKSLDEYGTGTPVIRMNNISYSGYLDLTNIKMVELSEKEKRQLTLQPGDILFNRTNSKELVGKTTIFDNEESYAFASYLIRFRVNPDVAAPEYVWGFLNSKRGKEILLGMAKGAVNQSNINKTEFLSIKIPLPPIELQRQFSTLYQRHLGTKAKFENAVTNADYSMQAMLNKAFTGELTAAWEAAHAGEIEARQRLHEQLPALLLLAFVYAKAQNASPKPAVGAGHARDELDGLAGGEAGGGACHSRAWPAPTADEEAALLITALMKYAFLAQMEGASRARLFHFKPYHYGPFSEEVYAGLDELQKRGLVKVEQAPDEGKTRILLADPAQAAAALAGLPDSLKRDVDAIIGQYGALKHTELLQTVYGKYPAYAKKSRLRSLQI